MLKKIVTFIVFNIQNDFLEYLNVIHMPCKEKFKYTTFLHILKTQGIDCHIKIKTSNCQVIKQKTVHKHVKRL